MCICNDLLRSCQDSGVNEYSNPVLNFDSSLSQEEELKKSLLLVFANKQDMEGAMSPSEVANSLGLPALRNRKWQIFKTSAIKGIGLEEAMQWWVVEVYKPRS